MPSRTLQKRKALENLLQRWTRRINLSELRIAFGTQFILLPRINLLIFPQKMMLAFSRYPNIVSVIDGQNWTELDLVKLQWINIIYPNNKKQK